MSLSMGERYYGTMGKKGANLADLTYGHRFHSDQQQLEYLLEFLNVFVGFSHRLDHWALNEGYQRRKLLGLRRFVFGVGEGEKPSEEIYKGDVEALHALKEKLRQKIEMPSRRSDDDDPLEVIRSLFRSFTGVARSRSWYAKSLFPVNEAVLWWEGLRSRAEAKKTWLSETDPDVGFSLGSRNFFARGGEMVYLMLAEGCRHKAELRARLEGKLSELLQQHHTLGELATLIETTWQEVKVERGWGEDAASYRTDERDLGYIWAGQEDLFQQFAEDVDHLLSVRLDSLELTEALMYLIGFYVVLYWYRRAGAICGSTVVRPVTIFVDAHERSRVLRQVSVQSFQRNHEQLIAAAEELLMVRLLKAVREEKGSDREIMAAAIPEMWTAIEKKVNLYVPETSLTTRSRGVLQRLGIVGQADEQTLTACSLFTFVMDVAGVEKDFKKQFLSAHIRLTKEMQLVIPKTGISQRYHLSGGLLKAIVLAAMSPEETQLEFNKFVERIFQKYGLVIGPDQVGRAAKWLREVDVNHQHYQHNLDEFRGKLRTSGLLKEYSDATALVMNKATRVREGR